MHENGIIHRDLKPENLLLSRPPHAGDARAPESTIPQKRLAKALSIECKGLFFQNRTSRPNRQRFRDPARAFEIRDFEIRDERFEIRERLPLDAFCAWGASSWSLSRETDALHRVVPSLRKSTKFQFKDWKLPWRWQARANCQNYRLRPVARQRPFFQFFEKVIRVQWRDQRA